jgi:ABC-2 type transport system permease protein
MRDSLRLYLGLVGISVRSQLQYRASTLMLATGHLLTTGVEFLAIWALFDRFGHLEGWSLAEVALLYGMANVAFAMAESVGRGFDVFDQMVKSGEFDRLLLRPRATAFQVAAQEIHLMRAGRLLQGVIVVAWAVRALDVEWSWLSGGLLVAATVGGACIFVGLFVLQATLAFWTIQSLEIVNTVTYGGVETTQYPLAIYHTWFRRFFTFVIPLACLNYFPALAITQRPDPLGTPSWVPWVSPAVGVAFLALCLQIWRFGVRHYRSTGS